jgi:hypothetical protein
LADAGLSAEELWFWFFETLLGRDVPDQLLGYARQLDFHDVDSMRRAALREYLFKKHLAET